MRIGIFFGGPAREREISFAGGKTAYEHLDKSLFDPVPVFVDSFGRFIKLNPKWMYEPEIRNFYPPQPATYALYVESFPELKDEPVSPEVGELLTPDAFSKHFDFALLAMHGPDCEDGAIQGLLEWYRIPYSGPGIMGSAVGIDKILQNEMISLINHQQKKTSTVSYAEWTTGDKEQIFQELKKELGLPLVIKAPHQGSSIGVAILKKDDLKDFISGVNQCFFQTEIDLDVWKACSRIEKEGVAQKIANLNEGIGYPVQIAGSNELVAHPDALIRSLDSLAGQQKGAVQLLSTNAEDRVLFEEFIEGQEFSCGCIQDDSGRQVALPPTEIIKVSEVFDYDSKYKPGATRKRIPMDTSLDNNRKVQEHIATVTSGLGIDVCVRIDGFLTPGGEVLLHDPNTIPGMSPTSLIFKQMAEIGLNVTQTITYFIRQSIRQRITTSKDTVRLRIKLEELDKRIRESNARSKPEQIKVIDANDSEFELARKWWGKMNAEGKYTPVVMLKSGDTYARLTVPHLFKEYVEDIIAMLGVPQNALLEETRKNAIEITRFYGGCTNFDAIVTRAMDRVDQ